MNSVLKAMHLCFATFCIFFLVNPCLASNRHTVGAETCLHGIFSGRVPVSAYWGFPGPGPQYKSHQHRLGISFLSCWVGRMDSPHLSVQKAWTLFGLYCMKCWGSEQSFWTRVPFSNTLPDNSPTRVRRVRWLASRFSRHRDCPGVYKFKPTAFSREAYPGFPLNQVSWHRKQVMNLVTTYALTLRRVRTELKSIVLFQVCL